MGDQSSSDRGATGNLGAVGTGKIFDGYMSAWNAFAGEWGGAGKNAMQLNIELASFASRRAKAYLDMPAQLAACRQPQDFGNLQVSFWQTCFKQYAEMGRRVGQQMAEAQLLTGINESLSDPESAGVHSARLQPRDFITFPEPKSEPPAAADAPGDEKTEQPPGSRHAAA